MNRLRSILIALAPLAAALPFAGCDNMQHQENVKAFEPSSLFADDASARTPPPHTVPRSDSDPLDLIAAGGRPGNWTRGFPMVLTRDFVLRGQERYGIFCVECHGAEGDGQGIVVRRGFPRPLSFHDTGIRDEAEGSLFDAITRGKGTMYGFYDRISPSDRWAIIAYIRALEKSRNATLAEVPGEERRRLLDP